MTAASIPSRAGGSATAFVAGDGEIVILRLRPSNWFVLWNRFWVYATIAGVCLAAKLGGGYLGTDWGTFFNDRAGPVALLGMLLLAGWNILDLLCRSYVLTSRRISRASGIFQRISVEVLLGNVQSVTLTQNLRERVTGIGSIAVSTAGSGGGYDLSWYMIAAPEDVMRIVRDHVDRSRGTGPAGPVAGTPRAPA